VLLHYLENKKSSASDLRNGIAMFNQHTKMRNSTRIKI